MVMIYDDQGTKVFLINGTIKVFYWSLMMIYPIDDDEFFFRDFRRCWVDSVQFFCRIVGHLC